MIDGYDLLIGAQCSESMSSLKFSFEDVLQSLETEDRFDVKSRLCERIAFLIYQDSNFGLLPIPKSIESVSSCINRLCKSFNIPIENETFVGPCSSSESLPDSNHSRERVLCATLLTTPKEDLPSLLTSLFSSEYPSTATLSQKLLDNDERFLTSSLALLPLIETVDTSSIFHPVSIFLEAMHLISYDCEVLIDWLNSELAASSLILRVLKSNCNEKTKRFWTDYVPLKTPATTYSTTFREEPTSKSTSSKPVISLKVIEIVGDQEMTKTLNLRAVETKKVAVKKPIILRNCGKFEKWIQMVSELRTRLKRLLTANLVAKKLDLILKWCDKFCDVFNMYSIQEYHAAIVNLQDHITKMEKKVEKKEKEAKEMDEHLEENEEKLKEATEEIEMLKKKLKESEKKKMGMEEKLKEANEDLEKKTINVMYLEKECTHLDQEIHELQKTVYETEEEMEELKTKDAKVIEDLEKKLKETEKELEGVKVDVGFHEKSLKNNETKSKIEMACLEENHRRKMEKLMKEMEELRGDSEEKEKRIEALEKALEAKEQDVDELHKEVGKLYMETKKVVKTAEKKKNETEN
ncbi:hypothetical protein GCK72_015129 [Caenorhabditis remanei]|uniref:Uncharacterized protein n=1 Tax=Caenorhabditis remanei TaxID=31234 RepID=A0A6A5GTA4_CAERE|nr:hypothetical protein GCK72_015129 [Caenorhabditis remanei]KAF1758670.1 hypothetical protein GCK72_015129 [Caenorhabditis remanei]